MRTKSAKRAGVRGTCLSFIDYRVEEDLSLIVTVSTEIIVAVGD